MTRPNSAEAAKLFNGGPIIHGDRCVHALAAIATCRACVTVCPQDAWILDKSRLSLDLDACDGCGLCQAVCPEAAIEIEARPCLRVDADEPVAFAACERAGIAEGEGVLPCLHALGLREVLILYRRGARRLALATGDCSTCGRGQAIRLEATVESLNVALGDRGLPAISFEHLETGDWKGGRGALDALPEIRTVSRRDLFRCLAKVASEPQVPATDGAGRAESLSTAASTLPPRRHLSDRLARLPVISAERCVGCDACQRICPHDAIRLEEDGDRLCYRMIGEHCTGCGLCVDVCEHDAVRVEAWVPGSSQTLLLKAARCRACGAPFHKPGGQASGFELCCVCESSGHHRKLFQVLD